MGKVTRMLYYGSAAVLLLLLLSVTCGEAAIHVEAELDTPETLIARLNPHGRPIRVDLDDDDTLDRRDACALPPTFPVGQQVMITIGTRDGDRHFALYIPTSYKPQRPHNNKYGNDEMDELMEDAAEDRSESGGGDDAAAQAASYPALPLHVLFHGLNDECARFMNHTQFLAQAEAEGYIVASACGVRGLLGIAWNAGTCCGFFNADKPDDLGFARRVVKAVAHGVCVDATRVMATGFSNGGMLAEVLGCTAADVFGAVASVGGVVEMRPGNDEGLRACDAAVNATDRATGVAQRPAVLLVHGDDDIKVPWKGNHYLGFPPVEKDHAEWARRNGCGDLPSRSTLNTTGFVNALYDRCTVSGGDVKAGHARGATAAASEAERNVLVELVRARGGGHNWFETDEFSTGNYIRGFAKRVFDDEAS